MTSKNKFAYCLLPIWTLSFFVLMGSSSCHVSYKTRDISIPPEIKTARVGYFEPRARYNNPQLPPQITDKLRQKINNQTRLTLVQSEDAHYDISGQITGYDVTTSGISQQQAATNRLIVTVRLVFKNRLDATKNFETTVSRNFDFSASLSLTQAETQLTPSIVQNMVDEIFNKIFSNW